MNVDCSFFNLMLPSEKIEKRRIGFESKFSNCTSCCTILTYVHNYVNIVTVEYLLSCLVKLVKIFSFFLFFNTTSYSDTGE